MFGLVDCNNFYCSCERVFNPALRTRPVVVLSNNDGCIIARSNEAKALGIAMGAPFYQAKAMLEANKVAVFSSNYTLYGDMSRRVMMLLADFSPELTQYSIDEAFIGLDGFGTGEVLREYGRQIVGTICRGTGIPVTLGIAPTKTLAKVAAHYGKRYKGYGGVCIIDNEERRAKALRGLAIGDVWGIGRRNAAKLERRGVHSAWDFAQLSEAWVRELLSVTGVRTWKELHGESCIDVGELPQKKSICTSRSFADAGLGCVCHVEEAVAGFAAACSRKLKEQRSCCGAMTVFAYTSRFRSDVSAHCINRTVAFPVATADRQELVAAAVGALRAEWPGDGKHFYKKAGVIVWDTCPSSAIQANLFDPIDRGRQARLAAAADAINRKGGRNAVRLAVEGSAQPHNFKREHASRHFTTDIGQVIRVRA